MTPRYLLAALVLAGAGWACSPDTSSNDFGTDAGSSQSSSGRTSALNASTQTSGKGSGANGTKSSSSGKGKASGGSSAAQTTAAVAGSAGTTGATTSNPTTGVHLTSGPSSSSGGVNNAAAGSSGGGFCAQCDASDPCAANYFCVQLVSAVNTSSSVGGSTGATVAGSTGSTAGSTGGSQGSTSGTSGSSGTSGEQCTPGTYTLNNGDVSKSCPVTDGGRSTCALGEDCIALTQAQGTSNTGECTEICDPTVTTGCPGATICLPIGTNSAGQQIGVCVAGCDPSTGSTACPTGQVCALQTPNAADEGLCLPTGAECATSADCNTLADGGAAGTSWTCTAQGICNCTVDSDCAQATGPTLKCDAPSGTCYVPCSTAVDCANSGGGCCAQVGTVDYCDPAGVESDGGAASSSSGTTGSTATVGTSGSTRATGSTGKSTRSASRASGSTGKSAATTGKSASTTGGRSGSTAKATSTGRSTSSKSSSSSRSSSSSSSSSTTGTTGTTGNVTCTPCTQNSDCGSGNFCITDPTSGDYCGQGGCQSDSDCLLGQACYTLTNGSGATIGTACYPGTDSTPGSCSSVGTDVTCTKCTSDADCQPNGLCALMQGRTYYCSQLCTTNADCASTEYCTQIDSAGDMGCFPKSSSCTAAAPPPPRPAPIPAAPSYCLPACAAGGECPFGSACQDLGSGVSACVPTNNQCVANTSCPTASGLRAQGDGSQGCLTGATVLFQNSPGAAVDGGGTKYAGDYYVGDSTGWLLVYKSKKTPATGDPSRGTSANLSGTFGYFPTDAGTLGQAQLSGSALTITPTGSGTLPTAATPTLTQLDYATGDSSLVGQYVQVPAGTYTQNSMSPVWTYTSSSGTYYDGVLLTSGATTIAVETSTFQYSTTSCQTDGGLSFSAGGFKGVFDTMQTDDGAFHTVIVFGDCSDM